MWQCIQPQHQQINKNYNNNRKIWNFQKRIRKCWEKFSKKYWKTLRNCRNFKNSKKRKIKKNKNLEILKNLKNLKIKKNFKKL